MGTAYPKIESGEARGEGRVGGPRRGNLKLRGRRRPTEARKRWAEASDVCSKIRVYMLEISLEM